MIFRTLPLASAVGTVALSLATCAAPAGAFPISPQTCGQFSVDPSTSCSANPGLVDDAAAIGVLYPPANWTFLDKDESSGESDDDFLLTNLGFGSIDYGTTQDGFFFVSTSLLSSYDEFVLVLSGGRNEPLRAAFFLDVAALVDGTGGGRPGYFYGAWSTALTGLEHASLYGRCASTTAGCTPSEVPEPAALALLGLGLTGLGIRRRQPRQ